MIENLKIIKIVINLNVSIAFMSFINFVRLNKINCLYKVGSTLLISKNVNKNKN